MTTYALPTITAGVYARISFLTVTDPNTAIIGGYIAEVMQELESCFKIGIEDSELVGDDANYNGAQKSLIMDMVAVYMLQRIAAENASAAENETTEGAGTFIKKAKAGTVEVEYEQLDSKKGSAGSTLVLKAGELITMYRQHADRKAGAMGCVLYDPNLKDAGDGPMPFVIFTPNA